MPLPHGPRFSHSTTGASNCTSFRSQRHTFVAATSVDSAAESGAERHNAGTRRILARQTPCRLHVPALLGRKRQSRHFAGVIQCYILVTTTLALPPSATPTSRDELAVGYTCSSKQAHSSYRPSARRCKSLKKSDAAPLQTICHGCRPAAQPKAAVIAIPSVHFAAQLCIYHDFWCKYHRRVFQVRHEASLLVGAGRRIRSYLTNHRTIPSRSHLAVEPSPRGNVLCVKGMRGPSTPHTT